MVQTYIIDPFFNNTFVTQGGGCWKRLLDRGQTVLNLTAIFSMYLPNFLSEFLMSVSLFNAYTIQMNVMNIHFEVAFKTFPSPEPAPLLTSDQLSVFFAIQSNQTVGWVPSPDEKQTMLSITH